MMSYINPGPLSKAQCIEFGTLLNLVIVALTLFKPDLQLLRVAILTGVLTLVMPKALYPIAYVWFAFAKVMSSIGPLILLSIVFILLVTPMGLFRRLLGKGMMRQHQFKKGRDSVMHSRDHLYKPDDFLHLF
jgi:hypothetical protein